MRIRTLLTAVALAALTPSAALRAQAPVDSLEALFARPVELGEPAQGSEAGRPFVTTFSPADYDAGGSNWDIAEDDRGVVYVGNESGLLEYDGARWRLIFLPNLYIARAVASDSDGRIWVGGDGHFGYLAPDAAGRMAFQDLEEHIPEADGDPDGIDSIEASDGVVYFQNPDKIFRWDGEAMRVWRAETSFGMLHQVEGVVYVFESGRGLFRVERGPEGEVLEAVPGSEQLAHKINVEVLVPFESEGREGILVSTGAGDLAVWDGEQFEPFETEADEILTSARLVNGVALPGAGTSLPSFALGTQDSGVVIIDHEGRLLHHLHQDTGLGSNNVKHLHASRRGGLWVALMKGIAHVEVDAPYTRYSTGEGIDATPIAVTRHDERLYVGGMGGGVVVLDPAAGSFRKVSGTESQNLDLLSTPAGLLAAGIFDVSSIDGERSTPVGIPERQVRAVRPWPGRTDRVVVGHGEGLSYLERVPGESQAWRYAGRISGVDLPVYDITEGPDGALWLNTVAGRVVRVRLRSVGDSADAEATVFDTSDGLPPNYVMPYRLGDTMRFTAKPGRLFRYEPGGEGGRGRFVEASTFEPALPGHPLSVMGLRGDSDGQVWISTVQGPPVVARPQPDGTYAFEALDRFRDDRIRDVYSEGDGVVWLLGQQQLIRLDTRREAAEDAPPPLIRWVASEDRVLYGGGAESAPTGEVPYSTGAVRFAWAAPGALGTARYRTRLEGFDEGWSAWTTETERAYTNVPPGRYRFIAEADGRGEAAYALTVLPPWYRTWWAYGLFGGAVALALVGAYRQRTRHLYRRQRELDAEVAARTEELRAEKQKTEEQAAQLRELDEAKSRFFANVSHEFRTPLTLTIGPLEDLRDGMYGPLRDEAQQPIGLAVRSARRVLDLINQILDVAKLDAQRVRLQARRLDIGAFLQQIADAFVPLAERLDIDLAVHRPVEPTWTWADPEALDKVLSNLLSNAFKFTPEGGTIRATLDVTSLAEGDGASGNGVALLTVADSGPGITSEHLPHLFDRFYQADGTDAYGRAGTGIGLALAKELTELHGGTIAVESTPGEGAAFTVRLPLGRDHLAPDQIAPETDGLESVAPAADMLAHDTTDEIAGPSDWDTYDDAVVAPVVEPDDGEDRPTLLLVDDHAGIRAYVRRHFQDDYRIVEAADGQAALDLARDRLPDLVISDVMMPVLDGVGLCRALKNDPATDFIPVVLLTAKAGEEAKLEGLGAEADDYVTKPFNVRELAARVENLIRQRQRLRERFSVASGDGAILPVLPPGLDAADEALVEAVREAIEANLEDEDFGVEALAEAVGVSRSSLYRRLGDALGQTPPALLKEARLARAARLLSARVGNVSEVAYAVGFKSTSHFSRAFRDAYGVPPSAYGEEQVAKG